MGVVDERGGSRRRCMRRAKSSSDDEAQAPRIERVVRVFFRATYRLFKEPGGTSGTPAWRGLRLDPIFRADAATSAAQPLAAILRMRCGEAMP
jgi:hypothetical protein